VPRPSADLSPFHPTLREWFAERLGEPTPPQRRGWPLIRAGGNVLVAAPTGSGKTLAAFLSAIDSLLRAGSPLPDQTSVLYVSPLKALANDVRKNLELPLAELRARDPSLPEVRVLVRTGDTPQRERAAMAKRPPHLLVTTPESLYILLTSEAGRAMLRTVRTAILDEIHAVLGDKRGSHLSLSLERLEALAGPFQRIGLSATQRPIEEVARFLAGEGRECAIVDEGHARVLDLGVEIPRSPLAAVCSHEVWGEIYGRIADLVREHRTTLVFVGTRKMAERIAAALTRLMGEEQVTCHHGSLSRERRLDAEERLKAGKLRALVATASLELGIDVGEVDLAIVVGATRSIATFLQRVGRSGHALGRVPKGRIFPLTRDELVEAAALLRAVRLGLLDRSARAPAALDILAQQIVAACVPETWEEDALFDRMRRAFPYRDLDRKDFDAVVALHANGRRALLHRDGVHRRLRATRRARLVAVTSGGAIPDRADYQVVADPEGILVGTLDEDFAVESDAGDIVQLGNASWRILKVGRGIVRVADAKGAPPSLPFWLGEAPSRTRELSGLIGEVRERGADGAWVQEECGLPEVVAREVSLYIEEGVASLGSTPTGKRVVAERFLDEAGGAQLVLHAPFGGRINRAWGLALRKRFCRRFGFELQAAANEEAIVLSLGPHHRFPLEEVFDYLRAATAREVLVQAVLATPMFGARWRWNAGRSLLLERARGGRRVPAPLLRMRAEDLLVEAFPDAIACGETLPPGDLRVPEGHPLVRQTIEDCLREACDLEGLLEVLRGLEDGTIAKVAVETREPSAFARGVLSVRPYGFLDDAPLEERRTQAVRMRRFLDPREADAVGDLDPEAVRRVREEAWPSPRDDEEVHEALLWMGFATVDEARSWEAWLERLAADGRVVREGDRWFAAEASRNPKDVLRGRLEALGPVTDPDPLLADLEREGFAMRVRMGGREAWCERRLLARILRYTLDALHREIEAVSPADFLRFLACWQHVDEEFRLEGPAGLIAVVNQLTGFEAPAAAWERNLLAARVRDYRPEWLDDLTLRGEAAWGRLWGSGRSAVRATPICVVPREEAESWAGLAGSPAEAALGWRAQAILDVLKTKGATFPQDLARACGPLPSDLEAGLGELLALGLVTNDSFGALRDLLVPPWKRKDRPLRPTGRWSLFRRGTPPVPPPEFVIHAMLRRYGVVFRALLSRERQPMPWRDLLRTCRTMELRGEIRGGRFVAGFSGEQFALPTAVDLLREIRRKGPRPPVRVSAADPINLAGVLTPEERVPATSRRKVSIA
jgi:ATP-dependent helicase Lhr and Lhr-like helicase